MAIDLKKLEKQKGKIFAGLIAFQKSEKNDFFQKLSLSEKIEVYSLAQKKGFSEIVKKFKEFWRGHIFHEINSFTEITKALKEMKTRDDPWEYLFHQAGHLLKSPKELAILRRLSKGHGDYDQGFIVIYLKENFDEWLKKTKTTKELVFLKKLVRSCYERRTDFDEEINMISRIDSCIFSLVKDKQRELMAIAYEDKYNMSQLNREKAMKLLAA